MSHASRRESFQSLEHTAFRPGRPSVVEAMTELLAILRQDPHDRSGQYKIKKLAGYKAGEGQWRIRWKEYRLRYDIFGNDVVLYSFRHPKDAY